MLVVKEEEILRSDSRRVMSRLVVSNSRHCQADELSTCGTSIPFTLMQCIGNKPVIRRGNSLGFKARTDGYINVKNA